MACKSGAIVPKGRRWEKWCCMGGHGRLLVG
jgi:hypothetical protein